MSGIFASALISAGWSAAAAAMARLGGAAILLAVPAVLQVRGEQGAPMAIIAAPEHRVTAVAAAGRARRTRPAVAPTLV